MFWEKKKKALVQTIIAPHSQDCFHLLHYSTDESEKKS